MASGILSSLLASGFKAFKYVSQNSSQFDALPSYGDDWIWGIYNPSWASKPHPNFNTYGIVLKITVPDVLWGWEIAISTDPHSVIYVRNSINGGAWSTWSRLPINPLFYITDSNILPNFDSQPTSASTKTFTCPDNGWIYMYADRGSTAGNTLYIHVDGVARNAFPAYNAYATASIMLPVQTGQVIKLTTDSANPTWTIRQMSFKN